MNYCPNCGTEIIKNNKFCPSCGFVFRNYSGIESMEDANNASKGTDTHAEKEKLLKQAKEDFERREAVRLKAEEEKAKAKAKTETRKRTKEKIKARKVQLFIL